jgi:AraC-like DNA-binding protein
MSESLHYEIPFPNNIPDILNADFWVYDNLSGILVNSISEPIKFSASVSIFVRSGECDTDLNLINYKIKSPCIVNIRASQILQINNVSPDFNAAFIVMSKRLTDSIMMSITDSRLFAMSFSSAVMPISPEDVNSYEKFYSDALKIVSDKENPYSFQALQHLLLSFFYSVGYKNSMSGNFQSPSSQSSIADRFLTLVQNNFRSQRFLDFYASSLKISTKYLSKVIKNFTGYSAVEWIDRYIILEAKVMLKSSHLTIQQISDELHFPSQSFFGKYFKKHVGMTPKDFRNSAAV